MSAALLSINPQYANAILVTHPNRFEIVTSAAVALSGLEAAVCARVTIVDSTWARRLGRWPSSG